MSRSKASEELDFSGVQITDDVGLTVFRNGPDDWAAFLAWEAYSDLTGRGPTGSSYERLVHAVKRR